MTNRHLGHRAPLLWLVLPLIGGMALARVGSWDARIGPLTAAVLLVTASLLAGAHFPRWWAGLLTGAMLLGGGAVQVGARAWPAAWATLPPREAWVDLRITRVFPRDDPRRTAGLAVVARAEAHLRDLEGQRVYFSLTRARDGSAPIRSATIAVVGVLLPLPRRPPANTFDGYLANAGVNFRLTRGRVLAETHPPRAYYRFCARAAERFQDILGHGIAEKQPALAGLLRAMMLGWKHELSDEQHRLFMASGTMHLFAISGLHIGVIALALESLLALLRLPVRLRFALGAGLLWLFVDITGGTPSAVRAFIMATFVRAAPLLRRPGNPLAALAASALVVLLLAPLQVFGASFLMSYGIVFALLLMGVPLGEAWQERWRPWRDLPIQAWAGWQHRVAAAWRGLLTAVGLGVAATLVSLLTGVMFFQLLTPGALLTNLGLIPAAMFATAAGFVALLCGLAGLDGAVILCTHAAALTLAGIQATVTWSVTWPGAFLPAGFAAPWVGLTSLALLLGTMIAGYATRWQRAGRWWPPFVIVALTLGLGTDFGGAPEK